MSNTIDQQFIEYIVKSLVSKPDEVKIERRIDEKGVLLELTVDSEDLGRVIGKRGATAQSLRTLLRALGTKQDARYNLKIIDPSGGFNNRQNNENRDDRGERPEKREKNENSDKKVSGESEEDMKVDRDVDTIVGAFTDDEEVEKEETEHSDRISKAREELADLDDLDV